MNKLLATNREKISKISKSFGLFTPNQLAAAGFQYTGVGDTAVCKDCRLEISNWTLDMQPYEIHSKQRYDCPFIQVSKERTNLKEYSDKSNRLTPAAETVDPKLAYTGFSEVKSLQQIRKRTFSHWPNRTVPSSAQMIEAGFFNCNVGDRVICIYCNLICQQWTPHTDDPCEVHKTLSPTCPYVIATVEQQQTASFRIVNEESMKSSHANSANGDIFQHNDMVHTTARHTNYIENSQRRASFATWPNENLLSVDDLVSAGFFYTGTGTTVTCFYCNGSLRNWGASDSPMIEHARWFPHCAYVKQLGGDKMYRKMQESKRAHQERAQANEARSGIGTRNGPQLLIPDENTLLRLVIERLDLPVSKRLLDNHFKLSIIKRCWKEQLRLKLDDFVSDSDLYVACLILQKQIEHINGRKENIVIPSIKMQQIRQLKGKTNENVSTDNRTSTGPLTEITSSSTQNENKSNDVMPSNPCVLCLTEEKRLACIPCGHLATCVSCGHSLRSCPICRMEIEAFVRVYI